MRHKLVSACIAAAICLAYSPAIRGELLAQYEFDDEANLGLDSAGGDNNGTQTGTDTSFSPEARFGAGALAIDGSGIGLELANPATFQPLTTFTIAAFVHPDLNNPDWGHNGPIGRVFGSLGIDANGTQFGTNSGYGFGLRDDGFIRYTTYGIQDYDHPATVPDDQWTHVAVVVVGGNATFYQDGARLGTINGGNPAPTTNPFYIGASAFFDSDRFVGLMDDVRVYDDALGDEEIAQLANPGIPGDVNQDGVVDLNDFDIIRQNFAKAVSSPVQGDLDFSGVVDFADFRLWKTAAGAPAAVPEPATFLLALAGSWGLVVAGARFSRAAC